jgi:2-oxoglutarate dehydrogenase E1 component
MDEYSFVNNAHPDYIDQLYQSYKNDPGSIDDSWRTFFDGYEFAKKSTPAEGIPSETAQKERAVLNLINDYRGRGHLFTKTNPVRTRRKYSPTLDLKNYKLSETDLDTVFQAGSEIGLGPAKLRDIVEHLQETYCYSIGAEFRFIRIPERLEWLQHRMESTRNQPRFTLEKKKHILNKLNQAVVFENFLHTKFVGQKRFSLQGGETLIPGLDAIIQKGAELGISEFLIGMPHRGRLNVLANVLQKKYEEIFSEFEGAGHADAVFEGDVKYHLGYSNTFKTLTGDTVTIGLAPNPSHLEAVNPVVEGMARAKIDHKFNGDETRVLPILIHGDAAIAAQGVVYEVIQMSLLNGYRTGGTVHLVVNNQLGFTTNYLDGRSSTYCTDVAKVTLSPVFHVNADDVEAVVFATELALEYRQKFHTDVFIDLLGYRKYGHNESDEPRFTQPSLYSIIASHPDPREIYLKKLVEQGTVDAPLAGEMEADFKASLQKQLELSRQATFDRNTPTFLDDCDLKKHQIWHSLSPLPQTGVAEEKLIETGKKVFSISPDVKTFDKIAKLYQSRYDRLVKREPVDWAMGEMMAYATLLCENVPIRISGQDSERGTFSHRHAIILDEETEEKYVPLNHLTENQARFEIIDSLLSEYGVLGFEYGYSCATPNGLTIWEAQFGDFANGGQIIIDQFLSCSEAKWNRSNGLVLYLPHGFEGQGPEHSSARVERFLHLCAHDNMHVVNATTPANFFHLLRAHVKYPFRIPLILFTPKSLLRHPLCVSDFDDFVTGSFLPLIDDPYVEPEAVSKVLFCSGKIYYELYEKQQAEKRKDIAIIRLEQFYPAFKREVLEIAKKYSAAREIVWVQEEPENMGAWSFISHVYKMIPWQLISRDESPTPATGYYQQHLVEQKDIIDRAFACVKNNVKKRAVASLKIA